MSRGHCVVAGIGQTTFGALPGRTTLSMNVEASRAALADAGIDKDMVDGVFVKFPTSKFEHMYAHKICEAMGLQPRMAGVLDQAGASNISLIAYAAMAIEAGQCEIALITFADNPKTGPRDALARPRRDGAEFGYIGPPAGYAMMARAHMERYGTTSEQLGEIAVACREHGARNPHAQLRKPITLDDHQQSRFIIDPLRRDDCCLVSDGGAAVVVMSAERARQLGVADPVAILGYGQGHTAWELPARATLTTTAATVSAQTAFAMAGVGPRDIDVAQLYDCFTITVLMTLESYGFCREGDGGQFVAGGNISLRGSLPVNTSGGLLSESGMPGMQLVLEGVRQVRGTSTGQVPGAELSLVSNQGGVMQSHSTLVLGR